MVEPLQIVQLVLGRSLRITDKQIRRNSHNSAPSDTIVFCNQQEKELVGLFLQRKYLLAKRLRPNDTEEDFVSLILETIKPSIRKILRAANPTTFTNPLEYQ